MKYGMSFGFCLRTCICSHYGVFLLVASSLLIIILTGYLSLTLEQWLALSILAGALLYLSLIDIKRRVLPDRVVLPLLWLGLLSNAWGLFTTAELAIFGAPTGYICLYAINGIYRLVRQQDGIGYGDVKLFSALGAWAGVQALPIILVLAAGSGLLTFMMRGGLRWCVSRCNKSASINGMKTDIVLSSRIHCNDIPLNAGSAFGRLREGRYRQVRHLSSMNVGRSRSHTQPSEVHDIVRISRGRKTVSSTDRSKKSLQEKNFWEKKVGNERRNKRSLRRRAFHKGQCVSTLSELDITVLHRGESHLEDRSSPAYLKEGIPFGPSLACAGWGYLVISTSGMDMLPLLFANAFQ